MNLEPLQLLWFVLLGLLLAGYGILDGFDLGVGILHMFARQDRDRRIFMNSIGPLWDGNEVWLVVFGGALFAAFPRAYATACSGLYTPMMLILFALIFRGVSMEFRSKLENRVWRRFWDVAFSLASILATFLFGVAVGNSMVGLPITADGDFAESVSLALLLRPYPVLTGLFAVATFAMHGAIFLYLKTEGELQQRIHRWMWITFGLFLTMYLVVSVYTLTQIERSTAKYAEYPWAWSVPILNVLAIALIPRAIYTGRALYAFVASSCTIAAFTFLFGLTLFPNMIVSSLRPEWNLTVASAASTDHTLGLMAIIAMLGMPFVLSYTVAIYWMFRGKTRLGHYSY